MSIKRKLFLIDYQNDFMDATGAALPVPGARADAKRLADFIVKFAKQFDSLYLTQDSHHINDISHPSWWKTKDGKFISPFTTILPEDIANGTYVPQFNPRMSIDYVNALSAQGEFPHFIWPEHCIVGSWGHGFQEDISKATAEFERQTGRWVNIITKGSNPFTEHFGAFRANIPQANDSSTQLNQTFLQQLNDADEFYFTGEARSHCVATSLRQLCDEVPDLLPKMIILTDGMSDVPGLSQEFYDRVDAIYARAKSMGARFAKTTDFVNSL